MYKPRKRSSYFCHNLKQMALLVHDLSDYFIHKRTYDTYTTVNTTLNPHASPVSNMYDLMEMELLSHDYNSNNNRNTV